MKQREPSKPSKHDAGKPQSSYDMQGGQSRDFHEENARNHELRERNRAQSQDNSKDSERSKQHKPAA